jgi:hypothetical protein
VAEAVLAGFVAVLSRAYGVYGNDGNEFKTLIPLLDALNHDSISPNVGYSFDGVASDAAFNGQLVARAIGDVKSGEELCISYGEHPRHVFGLYWGFVPSTLSSNSVEVEDLTSVPTIDGDAIVDSAAAAFTNKDSSDVRKCCVAMVAALRSGE